MNGQTDIATNRRSRRYSRSELLGRVLWAAAMPLFRFSPRLLWGWRRLILRCFRARIGRQVNIHPSVKITFPWNLEIGDWSAIGFDACIYNLGSIRIGQRVTISQRAHLCAGTHDYRDAAMTLLKPPIEIHDDAWICADAFVGPGTTIGRGAVVGARAAVFRDVEPWTIVAGNPATFLKRRELVSVEEPASSMTLIAKDAS